MSEQEKTPDFKILDEMSPVPPSLVAELDRQAALDGAPSYEHKLLAESGEIAGKDGGFWCMMCKKFVTQLVGKIDRLATHREGRAIHSVRRINPWQAPPER